MKRLTALIIDDERLARINLRKKLTMCPEIEVTGEASSITSAVKAIQELNPDVLFLDIQLSDGNGFDLLDKVEYSGKIIFVTAYDKYACRAFEINALDYLLKPVSKVRLKNVIGRLVNDELEHNNEDYLKFRYDDRIMIEQKKIVHFVKIENIIYIKANRDYTTLFEYGGKEYLMFKSIGEWQQKLPIEQFSRVHRNAIINFNYIESCERIGNAAKIVLRSIAEPVSISKGYYKLIKSRYFYK